MRAEENAVQENAVQIPHFVRDDSVRVRDDDIRGWAFLTVGSCFHHQ